MLLTRLPILLILPALCAAAALAQSPESSPSNLVVFEGAASMNASATLHANQALTTPNPLLQSGLPSALGGDSVAPVRAERDRTADARSLDSILGDGTDRHCLYIREYRVVRDSPDSDSTHRDGYTTCVPAARFRISITTERVR